MRLIVDLHTGTSGYDLCGLGMTFKSRSKERSRDFFWVCFRSRECFFFPRLILVRNPFMSHSTQGTAFLFLPTFGAEPDLGNKKPSAPLESPGSSAAA